MHEYLNASLDTHMWLNTDVLKMGFLLTTAFLNDSCLSQYHFKNY